MVKFNQIMFWVSVVMALVALGVLVYQVLSDGNWAWAIPAGIWGLNIFLYRFRLTRARDADNDWEIEAI